MSKEALYRTSGLSWYVAIRRFIYHFSYWFPMKYKLPSKPGSVSMWFIDMAFYALDVLGVSKVYSALAILMKFKSTRRLNEVEVSAAQTLFQDRLNYDKIFIDERAVIGVNTLAHAYVSCRIINCNGPLRMDVLIHELVHCWQYQHLGSMYIGRALLNHRGNNPYEYGGVQALYNKMISKGKFLDFTYEQQAEIIQDYYRKKHSNQELTSLEDSVYTYYANQLLDN